MVDPPGGGTRHRRHWLPDVEGGSLTARLADQPLPLEQSVRITREICSALVDAHGAGVLHCDLKPDNVLLDGQGSVRLCDFGQARMSHEHSPALGTLYYMAPEQADLESPPDARWDVYAVGVVLYEMLSGATFGKTSANEARHAERLTAAITALEAADVTRFDCAAGQHTYSARHVANGEIRVFVKTRVAQKA